ncbi:hypothetical protein NECAME_07912 [Necator americanus]|uniref:Uncharacterized protein n=1 Tax=Necator americanus TaxID=51031 RepID=W2TN19_NECAM|nr:hypothetical protein NECAME_07912 [Necator americanus]ETN82526.1 hypothetical protein NECAME_07912 [Necator americanus]
MMSTIALIAIGFTLLQPSIGDDTYVPPPVTDIPYPTPSPCLTPAPPTAPPVYCPFCSCNPPKGCIPREMHFLCLFLCPPRDVQED